MIDCWILVLHIKWLECLRKHICLVSVPDIIVSMCIRAFISIVARTVHVKMSASYCFKLWIRCVLVYLFHIVFLLKIPSKFILLKISLFIWVIVVEASFCVVLKISSSASPSKIASIIFKWHLRILILTFDSKIEHILLDGVIWFSKFFIAMSKMTFGTKDTRLMSIKVSASLCFIFLVNLRFCIYICILILIKWLRINGQICLVLERILIILVRRAHDLPLHHILLLKWHSILSYHLWTILISLELSAFWRDAHFNINNLF